MTRIEDYGLLGDLQSAALVGNDGSIDWLCLPRLDSPALFAALLGGPDAGRWRLAPDAVERCTARRYRDHTLVLETDWETPDGTIRVHDAMPPRGEAADVVRVVEGLSGTVTVSTELALRFDYGSIVPWIRRVGDDVGAIAGPDSAWLRTPVEMEVRDDVLRATFTVHAGERVPFVLTWHPSWHDPPKPVDAERALADTERYWSRWISRCTYDGPWGEEVRRSLLVLKALTYRPSGGIAAAATTSLPEEIGGERNWDYRYCWLRDAAFTLDALLSAGFLDEAVAWRNWLLRAAAGRPEDLQIMYSLTGERRLQEWEVGWLAGYERSRPVRVGNAAAGQFQLDVWGEVLDALSLAREAGMPGLADGWSLQTVLLDHLGTIWRQPDSGLWEVRGPRRNFVHSKIMAWVAADRMILEVEGHARPGDVERWRQMRDEIHAEVVAHGYDAERGTFTQFYGSRGLDASLLLIPRLGFLPPEDPRVVGTVEAVQRELTEGGLVLRYRPEAEDDGAAASSSVDGLKGSEGAFLACSFWLVDALALIGRREEAVELFERLLSLRNDLGLLSEEHDPATGRALGNMPQAFSHVSLVNAAMTLAGRRPAR